MTATTAPPLPGFAPRLRMTPQDARARSLRVRTVRLVFMGGAALAAAVFAGAVVLRAIMPASVNAGQVVQGDTMVIDAPRFVGRTEQGQRFAVTARTAQRKLGDPAAPIRLEAPKLEVDGLAEMTANSGIWTPSVDGTGAQRLALSGNIVVTRADGDRGTAQEAVWTPSPDVLALSGGVTLTRKTGETATSQVAVWRGADQSLTLEGGAQVKFDGGEATSAIARFGSGGRILSGAGGAQLRTRLGIASADRYEYDTETRRLRLTGRARATLNGQ